jgi:hypothetical protein
MLQPAAAIVIGRLDIDPVVMEDGAAAHVGVAFVGGDIDVGATAVQLRPVALDGGCDAGPAFLASLALAGSIGWYLAWPAVLAVGALTYLRRRPGPGR